MFGAGGRKSRFALFETIFLLRGLKGRGELTTTKEKSIALEDDAGIRAPPGVIRNN